MESLESFVAILGQSTISEDFKVYFLKVTSDYKVSFLPSLDINIGPDIFTTSMTYDPLR